MQARESSMTPQEQELVSDLFDRLAGLENNPRDPDAERLIADGLRRAPHATYALVQTALVMDEALKRANARIEELQAQLGGEDQPQQGGFLDNMREAVFGRRDPRGSVPTVRGQAAQPSSAAPPPYQSPAEYPPRMPSYPTNPAVGPGFGGGSFLGTAASTAAGVIGGSLLLDSIRSMFGHHAGVSEHERSAFGSSGDQAAPWSGGAADSDLARAAGIDSVGHGGVAEKHRDEADTALSDKPDDWNATDDDSDFADDDGGDFGGDDSDYA
jgi:uncharacterized protein